MAQDHETRKESTDGEGPLASGLTQGRTNRRPKAARGITVGFTGCYFFSSWYSSSTLMDQIASLLVCPAMIKSTAILAVSIE